MNKITQPSVATPHDKALPRTRQTPTLSEAVAHERHIRRLGIQMLRHHAQWVATGCFAARGSADGYRLQMQVAIGQRDPAVVELMEVQRGLA
jgi:hypothetical protein